MKLENWLKRKYPGYYGIIQIIFTEQVIKEYMKFMKYELAILIRDLNGYNKGTIFLVNKHGSMYENEHGKVLWDGTYNIYGLFYCNKSKTVSGYNHTTIFSENDYELL